MKTNKLRFYYRIILAACLCFLTAGILFTYYMIKDNNEKNVNFFKETAENTGRTIRDMIRSDTETLDGMALTMGQMEIVDLEHLLPILQEINNRNSFFRMGFINARGEGDMVDLDGTIHEKMDFSESKFFQEAMRGETSLSNTVKDSYSDIYLNYYGVPVVIKGEVAGVLAAADNTERIREILDTSIFRQGGFSNIIDSSGNYVIRSLKSPAVTNITEIGDFTAQEKKEILEELSLETGNLRKFENHGEKTWAVYLPLEVQDWLLLGIVEESSLSEDYYSILGIVVLITSAMGIFTFLVYGMNQIQAKSKQQLENLAYRDSVLGIDNYVKFTLDAGNYLRRKEFQKRVFWYTDVDNFKLFNESFGYEEGDNLLKNIAEILKQSLKPGDFFCRETADHFVGIRHFEDREELINWYENFVSRLEQSEFASNISFRLVLSIGFYCVETPEHVLSLNEMYNRAKMAQKSIKQIKNINYAFYSDEIRKRILKENEIESRMKPALENGEFKVYVQPKTAIFEDNRVVGGEALVRWIDPEKGMVNPGEFIPLFERNGFIIPLDRYMFQSVCQWLHDYLSDGGRSIRIAVNVSRLGIFQEDFVEFYSHTKKRYQIPDGLLELEFTESLAVEDNDLLQRRIQALQKEGFVCSLDDFGAGYSSLNTLKDLPIQVLKLDMLFFRQSKEIEKSRIIIQNVIRMAKELNIRIVAEGVEQADQVTFLRECGCDIIQGFVFEKPIPITNFQILVEKDPKGAWGRGFQHNKDIH